jgi:lysine 6-dehydrogenase
MRIAVLGAGMVGRTIAIDLSQHHEVSSFDINPENLSKLKALHAKIETVQTNLKEYTNYESLLKNFDFVVSAVPGFMGYRVLETVINCGKNIVDISFFPEDALQLDQLARTKNVTAIVDCGVAPGMGNLILVTMTSK